MKLTRVVAALGTPLHIRSLATYLHEAGSPHRLEVLLINCDLQEPRIAFYLSRLRQLFPDLALTVRSRTSSRVLRDVLLTLLRRLYTREEITLAVGNPRQWQNLLLARVSHHVDVLEEGVGTTRRGAYFDPSTPESSALKRLAQRVGILPTYAAVFGRIRHHYTSYAHSVFPTRRPVPFLAPDIMQWIGSGGYPREMVVVVASLFRRVGAQPYAELVSELLHRGVARESIWFSYHPKDDAAAVQRFCAEYGIHMLQSPLMLEDFLIGLLGAGHQLAAHGDANSSILLVNSVLQPDWRWTDHTTTVS